MIQRTLLRHSRAIGSRAAPIPATLRFTSPPIRISQPSFPALYSSRYYSATSRNRAEDSKTEDVSKEAEAAAPEKADPRDAKLEAQNKEIVDLKDKYLRSVAEFRNLQERTRREVSQARDFAIQKFAKDLVDSVDNLDRALSTVSPEKIGQPESNKDLESLHGGLKMTEDILMNTLKKHGLERFDPSEKGERFDPNKHEAQFMTKMEGKEDGSVFATIQKGFLLNGRVIRAAKVGVVKNS